MQENKMIENMIVVNMNVANLCIGVGSSFGFCFLCVFLHLIASFALGLFFILQKLEIEHLMFVIVLSAWKISLGY